MALSNPIFIVAEVNGDMEPDMHGTFLTASCSLAQASASLASMKAAQHAAQQGGPELQVLQVRVPSIYGYDGPASGLSVGQIMSWKPKVRPLSSLSKPECWVLTLNGDIGDGVQAIFATKEEAEAHLQGIRDKGLAVDCAEDFSYRIEALPILQ
jgi:hypothetical protein